MDKIVLVLVDGMRPDGMMQCGHPFAQEMKAASSYSLTAQTVMPSVTLPCHMSLFHSVDPDRHGIVTNTYTPQVRPIKGLFDRLNDEGKTTAMFYTWEELRDLGRPGSLRRSLLIKQLVIDNADARITDAAIDYIADEAPDFLFLYLGETDELGGHDHGWMSPEYMSCVHTALGCAEKVWHSLPDDYSMILTADHGGHGRGHGADVPEDMTIPIFFRGKPFAAGKDLGAISIKDIAPTVAKLLNVAPAREWEGHAVI